MTLIDHLKSLKRVIVATFYKLNSIKLNQTLERVYRARQERKVKFRGDFST